MSASSAVVKALVDAPESWMRCRGLAGMLVGEDPLHTERLWDKMYHGTLWVGRGGVTIEAMSAVDIALWDIKGKALGLPVHALLGGARRDTIPVYASMLFEHDRGLMRDRASRHRRSWPGTGPTADEGEPTWTRCRRSPISSSISCRCGGLRDVLDPQLRDA